MKIILDSRGKAMVSGGRFRTAQHARFLRKSGAGNSAAHAYIASAKIAYFVEAGDFENWTAGQQKHNHISFIK